METMVSFERDKLGRVISHSGDSGVVSFCVLFRQEKFQALVYFVLRENGFFRHANVVV